jgi:hypothetical protein
VYFDAKAMAGHTVSEQWLHDFDEQTKSQGKRILGLDGWGPQSTADYQADAKDRDVKLSYSPEECTDETAVTDRDLGNEVKSHMVKKGYKPDLEKSDERLEAWKSGKVTTSERRILFTKWLGDAWDHVCAEKSDMITKSFKKCGMFNDVDGKENHLVKLKRMPAYEPPAKSDPPLVVKRNPRRKRKNPLGSLLHAKRQKIDD